MNDFDYKAYHPEKGVFDVHCINTEYVFADCPNSPCFDENIFPVEDCELMKFIGLKDKNGDKIYGGFCLIDRFPLDGEDLENGVGTSLMPVVWCDKQLMWCVDASFVKDGSFLTSLVDYFGDELEIGGNIYEGVVREKIKEKASEQQPFAEQETEPLNIHGIKACILNDLKERESYWEKESNSEFDRELAIEQHGKQQGVEEAIEIVTKYMP